MQQDICKILAATIPSCETRARDTWPARERASGNMDRQWLRKQCRERKKQQATMQVADVPRHRIRAFPTYPKVIKHLFFQASNSDRLPKSTHIVLVGEPLCCPFFLHQPTPSAHPSSHSPSPSSSSSPPVSFVVHKMRTRFPLAPSLPCSSSFLPFVRLPASEQQAGIETKAPED